MRGHWQVDAVRQMGGSVRERRKDGKMGHESNNHGRVFVGRLRQILFIYIFFVIIFRYGSILAFYVYYTFITPL